MKKLLMVFLIAISSTAYGQGSQLSREGFLSRLDGEWYSNEWKYGYTLKDGVGVATSTNSPNFKVGDKIIFLQHLAQTTYEGTQVYKDGKFYKVTVELQSNDTLLFKGEKNVSWTMTKIGQASATSFDKQSSDRSLMKDPIAICLGDARKIKELIGQDSYNMRAFECRDSCDNARCQYIHTEILKKIEQDEIRQTKQKNVDLINRSRVNADVISQALNYVSGNGEDASGWAFWYPVNRQNGNCIFVATSTGITIDLNKGNPNAIQFFTQGNTYITRVDGLNEFRCNGCNGDRVQRAWALIYKECKGTRKAF